MNYYIKYSILVLFLNACFISDAQDHDTASYYWSFGKIHSTGPFFQGKKNGLWRYWDGYGELHSEIVYQMDKVRSKVEFDDHEIVRINIDRELDREEKIIEPRIGGIYKSSAPIGNGPRNRPRSVGRTHIGMNEHDELTSLGLGIGIPFSMKYEEDAGFSITLRSQVIQKEDTTHRIGAKATANYGSKGRFLTFDKSGELVVFTGHLLSTDTMYSFQTGPNTPCCDSLCKYKTSVVRSFQRIDCSTLGHLSLLQDRTEPSFSNGQPHGVWKNYYPNGKLWYSVPYKNGELDGQVELYLMDGSISVRVNFKNGLLDGPYQRFHENGVVSYSGMCRQGMLEGEWTWSDDTGVIKKRTSYASGNAQDMEWSELEQFTLIDGKKLGPYRLLDPDGRLLVQGSNVSSNERIGLVQEFHENGNIGKHALQNVGVDSRYRQNGIRHVFRWNNEFEEFRQSESWKIPFMHVQAEFDGYGKLQSFIYKEGLGYVLQLFRDSSNTWRHVYVLNGVKLNEPPSFVKGAHEFVILERGDSLNGSRDGLWQIFYPNGQIWQSTEYSNGTLNGAHKVWSLDGTLLSMTEFADGYLDGSMERYDLAGNLILRSQYQGGLLHGLVEEWNRGGTLKIREVEYEKGKRHGSTKTWKGGQYFERRYQNGKEQRSYYQMHDMQRKGVKVVFDKDRACWAAEHYVKGLFLERKVFYLDYTEPNKDKINEMPLSTFNRQWEQRFFFEFGVISEEGPKLWNARHGEWKVYIDREIGDNLVEYIHGYEKIVD